MTQEELIREVGKVIPNGVYSEEVIQLAFTMFTHGYNYAVEKACEWLREHLGAPEGIPQAKAYEDAINELTTEFRKGMYNG